MIHLYPFDGGTQIIVRDEVPGMDLVTWTEARYEEEAAWIDNAEVTNQVMCNISEHTVRPYPMAFSNHMSFDLTLIHKSVGFQLHAYDQYFDDFSPVPGGTAVIQPIPEITDRADAVISSTRTPSEIREWIDDPGHWIHLDTTNAWPAFTGLKDQAVFSWQGLSGPAFRLELSDNELWAPFDLTHSERYRIAADGETINPGDSWLDLRDGGHYDVHLRPRLWWVNARCRARFIYVDMVGYTYHDVDFIVESHMRPPVYQLRHNIFSTRETQPIQDYLGIYVSYDKAIDYAFTLSETGRQLSREIRKMEWHGWSSAYVLESVTAATLYIWAEVPRSGEVVAVFQPRDASLGTSQISVTQKVGLESVYPRLPVGVFWSDFFM